MGTSGKNNSDSGDTTTTTSPPSDTPDWMSSSDSTMGLVYAIMMKAAMDNKGLESPQLADVPSLYKTEEVDYTEKLKQLEQKARAEYALEQNNKKGRQDTIWTSSLLDDEDPDTTATLIG